jgi:hypothetical protein
MIILLLLLLLLLLVVGGVYSVKKPLPKKPLKKTTTTYNLVNIQGGGGACIGATKIGTSTNSYDGCTKLCDDDIKCNGIDWKSPGPTCNTYSDVPTKTKRDDDYNCYVKIKSS